MGSEIKSAFLTVGVAGTYEDLEKSTFEDISIPMNVEGLDSYTEKELKKIAVILATMAVAAGIGSDPVFLQRGLGNVVLGSHIDHADKTFTETMIDGLTFGKKGRVLLNSFYENVEGLLRKKVFEVT